MISGIYCFCSAVIILFVNLELFRIQTWFYISVVFLQNLFRIKLCIAICLLYDVLIVDQMFTFKIEPKLLLLFSGSLLLISL